MAFQSSVRFDVAGGMPGEIAYDGPHRAQPGILQVAAAVGNFCSEDPAKPGFWSPGLIANAVNFGMLSTPKQYASYGTTAGGPLAPTMILAANAEGEFTSMGQLWAQVTNANAKVGDAVYFNNTTGALVTAAPSAAAPATSTLIPGATVVPSPGGANAPALVVITLTGPLGKLS